MNKNTIAIALGVFLISASSCNNNPKTSEKTDGVEQTAANSEQTAVEFKIAENYFVNNTVKENVPAKITTQEEFDKYFGKATTMGENGKPTPIDFSKEYVIVADYNITNKKTQVTPVSLEKKGSEIVFNYKIAEGEDAGFTMRPFLAIIVSKNVDGDVILQSVDKN